MPASRRRPSAPPMRAPWPRSTGADRCSPSPPATAGPSPPRSTGFTAKCSRPASPTASAPATRSPAPARTPTSASSATTSFPIPNEPPSSPANATTSGTYATTPNNAAGPRSRTTQPRRRRPRQPPPAPRSHHPRRARLLTHPRGPVNAALVQRAALDQRPFAEHLDDRLAQCLGAVEHGEDAVFEAEPASDEVGE